MKLFNKIPRWYHCDSTYNTQKDAEERISELRKQYKKEGIPINIRLKKRNEKFFSVFTYCGGGWLLAKRNGT